MINTNPYYVEIYNAAREACSNRSGPFSSLEEARAFAEEAVLGCASEGYVTISGTVQMPFIGQSLMIVDFLKNQN